MPQQLIIRGCLSGIGTEPYHAFFEGERNVHPVVTVLRDRGRVVGGHFIEIQIVVLCIGSLVAMKADVW